MSKLSSGWRDGGGDRTIESLHEYLTSLSAKMKSALEHEEVVGQALHIDFHIDFNSKGHTRAS